MPGKRVGGPRWGTTEFCNVSVTTRQVLSAIMAGHQYRRDIEDFAGITEKQTSRALDKLLDIGAIKITPIKAPGRAGKSVRYVSVQCTEIGYTLQGLCNMIERHRRKRPK